MKFTKKEVAVPGKTVKKVVDGKEVEEKVRIEIEAQEYESLTELQNAAKGEAGLLAFGNAKVAEGAATAFRIAFNAAVKDGKSEDEAIAIGRAEAKKVYPSVRGPSKKEAEAQKDADFKAMLAAALSGKLDKNAVAELAAKYGVAQ